MQPQQPKAITRAIIEVDIPHAKEFRTEFYKDAKFLSVAMLPKPDGGFGFKAYFDADPKALIVPYHFKIENDACDYVQSQGDIVWQFVTSLITPKKVFHLFWRI